MWSLWERTGLSQSSRLHHAVEQCGLAGAEHRAWSLRTRCLCCMPTGLLGPGPADWVPSSSWCTDSGLLPAVIWFSAVGERAFMLWDCSVVPREAHSMWASLQSWLQKHPSDLKSNTGMLIESQFPFIGQRDISWFTFFSCISSHLASFLFDSVNSNAFPLSLFLWELIGSPLSIGGYNYSH